MDAVTVDTIGDGATDSIRPLAIGEPRIDPQRPLPRSLQRFASRLVRSPLVDVCSLVCTLAVISSYAPDALALPPGQEAFAHSVEAASTAYFGAELLARWAAAGLEPSYLCRPLMLVDVLSIVPALVGSSGPFAPLRLLRTLRVLRLRRLLQREPLDNLLRLVTGDPGARAWLRTERRATAPLRTNRPRLCRAVQASTRSRVSLSRASSRWFRSS